MENQYFSVETIKAAISRLENVKANWLIPTFVFAANDVNLTDEVDMAEYAGTDSFLDQYFDGSLMGLPPFSTGKNLLRPRMSGIHWNRGKTAGDYVIRQNTKMWANLFSSRGYREMRLKGQIEGDKSIVKLTDAFQPALEENIPASFLFEDFLVWLFAFSGFPNEIASWQELLNFLVSTLGLMEFGDPYKGRFKISGTVEWPDTLDERPTNETFQVELAEKLVALLAQSTDEDEISSPEVSKVHTTLTEDDPYLSSIRNSIEHDKSRSFLLAGPPGTGKTYYANELALALADAHPERIVFLQFHPGFSYDDFVEGFRPEKPKNGESGVVYEISKRHLLKLAERAQENPEHLYIMVVDELNRGDVARIFGEILTYIEVAYREKEFTLSLSGGIFSLPKNLVFIATANPFDRSVTELDDALLRRFSVFNLDPDRLFLTAFLRKQLVDEATISKTLVIFDTLNNTYVNGFGHTNFLQVRSVEDLAEVWDQRVKLGLKRMLLYDKDQLTTVIKTIEDLFNTDDENVTDNPDAE